MWNITMNGVNQMTDDYYGFVFTPEGFEVALKDLQNFYSEYEENDDTITDTNIREIFSDIVARNFLVGCSSGWPINGDTKEYKASFWAELERAMNEGSFIKEGL